MPKTGQIIIGLSHPPWTHQEHIDFSVNEMKELNIDTIRLGVSWADREPNKGEFYWKPFDIRMKGVTDNNLSLLLTIRQSGPDWACTEIRNENSCVYKNKEDFRTFIRELLLRYPNQIDKIQFGNEWDSDFWWIGTSEELVELNNILYDTVKELSSGTIVVLGGITRGPFMISLICEKGGKYYDLVTSIGKSYSHEEVADFCENDYPQAKENFLYVFENAKYEMIDLHLYDDVGWWEDYYNELKEISDKPVIVSELGGPNMIYESCETCSHPYTEEYQAEKMKEYFAKVDELGVEEAYYFKLIQGGDASEQHQTSGLMTEQLKKKASYYVLKEIIEKQLEE